MTDDFYYERFFVGYERFSVDYRRFFVDYRRFFVDYERFFVDYGRFFVDYERNHKKLLRNSLNERWYMITLQKTKKDTWNVVHSMCLFIYYGA